MDLINRANFALNSAMDLGADKAQCKITKTTKQEINIDAGKLSLMRTTYDSSVNFKVIKDGKEGTASINKTDDKSIKSVAREVIKLAESGSCDPHYDIAPKQEVEEFSHGELEADLEKMYARMAEFIDVSKEKYPNTIIEQSSLDFTKTESVLVNSNGVQFQTTNGIYSFVAMFTSKDGKNTSSFNYTSFSMKNLDQELLKTGHLNQLLAQSSEQTVLKPIEEKFEGEIIVTPHCLDIFIYGLTSSIRDGEMIQGSSIYKDKLGQKIADNKFNLHFRPVSNDLAEKNFLTRDGFKTENSTVIQNGVLKSFLLSQYGANKTDRERATNNGIFTVVNPGDTTLDDMIKSVKKGVLLCRFSAGRPNSNLEVSGVAKNSYLIEDGKIIQPISESMITANISHMFQNIESISTEQVNLGYRKLPWIKFSGVTISGK